MTHSLPLFGRGADRSTPLARSRQSGAVSVLLGVCVGLAIAFACPLTYGATSSPVPHGSAEVVLVQPAQSGEMLYTFTSCTAPDGSNCSSPYGGIVTPLEVGTTVGLMFFSSIFDTPPITGYVNWGDGSPTQSQEVTGGDCQCSFGPFLHTYNSAGTFTIVISDTQDGSEEITGITVSATAGLFSFNGAAIALGGLLGLGALVGALVSLRGPRLPSASASVPPPTIPTPVTTGFISDSSTGMGGVAIHTSMGVPPPGGYPSWAYDYRTSPYQPNPLIQGWPTLLQKFQLEHVGRPPAPPNWPFLTNPAPPTNFPGTFYQPRINPQTGQWAWWNPIDGAFL